MLYRISLPKLVPNGSIDTCAKAGGVCPVRSIMKIMIIDTVTINVESFA
jgi:hypothetical protein